MKKKRYVVLELEEGLEITVIGDYVPPEEESNFGGQFTTNKIEIVVGSLLTYTSFVEDFVRNHPDTIIVDHFDELALLKLIKHV